MKKDGLTDFPILSYREKILRNSKNLFSKIVFNVSIRQLADNHIFKVEFNPTTSVFYGGLNLVNLT
jgi:hypothetical protein